MRAGYIIARFRFKKRKPVSVQAGIIIRQKNYAHIEDYNLISFKQDGFVAN